MLNQETLALVIQAAKEAGALIMAHYQTDFSVQSKADDSPLTKADLDANNHIENVLSAAFPTVTIVSEESNDKLILPIKDAVYWLIDPLDGTKEFIKKNDEFTVNIALIKNSKPVLGVVYAPALDLLYYAMKGNGAYRSDSNQAAKAIHVNTTKSIPVKVACSRSHPGEALTDWLKKLGEYELAPMGSSLKICLVADGQADLYPRLGPTSLWDTGAAHCILNEAGGDIIDYESQIALQYNLNGNWLNPWFIAKSSNTDTY